VLLVIGTGALLYPALSTAVAVEVFGVMFIIAGVGHFIAAFHARGWGGVLITILCGLLYLFSGIVFVERPFQSAALLTLFLTMLFFALGTFRIATAITAQYSGWGWSVVSGLISILLAVMIWQDYPVSSFWVIGTFVGIDMIFAGWAMVMLALSVKNLPKEPTPATT